MTRALHVVAGLALRVVAPCGALLGALAVPALCAPAAAAQQPGDRPLAAAVTEAAHRFGIPELWIWRVMDAESRGRSRAVSHAGAMGLMQIMPGTWRMLTARHRLGSDPFDARANILAGAAYLRAMWDRYGRIELMLAAYNAGPARADAYAAGRRPLPLETRAYVAQIAPALGARQANLVASVNRGGAADWRRAALFARSLEDEADAPDLPSVEAPSALAKPSGLQAVATERAQIPLFVGLSGRGQ